jgi:hypothetical protein
VLFTKYYAKATYNTSNSIKFLDFEGNVVNVKSYNAGNYLQFQVPDSDLIVKIDFLPIPKYNVSVTSKNGVVYRTNSERNPPGGQRIRGKAWLW